MRAIQLERPEQFRRIEVAEPDPPGPGEALVRVHRVGICGTDMAGYLGRMPFFRYPRIPGHELGVEVVETGEGVDRVRPGDRCSVEPYMNCGTCFACRRGRGNCCESLQVLGVMTDGGLRERFLVRADKLHPSATLAFEQLALVETLGIGAHAVDRAAVGADDEVLVIGAGPIGLATMQFVRLAGARLLVLDLNEARLAFCREHLGADATVVAGEPEATEAQLRQLTGGRLPTAVFDATGSQRSMEAAFQYVAHTGRLVFVGITTAPLSFSHPLLHRREMSVHASRNALPADFTRIIGLIEAGRIDTAPWITHRSPFDRLPEDFPKFLDPASGVVKAIVELT